MEAIFTITLYLSLFAIMFILCMQTVKSQNWIWAICAVIIYSIVFGMRYGVGVDYMDYLDAYQRASMDLGINKFEYGFMFIMNLLAKENLHFSIFFGLIAFLQLFLIFKGLKKDLYVYPFFCFVFMIGCSWLNFSNGLRQVLAFGFFVLSISYVEKRQWIKHYICILLAISMHSSATILLFLYPLFLLKENWFKNIKLQLILFAIAVICGEIDIISSNFAYFENLFSLEFIEDSDYSIYAQMDQELHRQVSKGLGFIIILATDILLVATSNMYKNSLKSKTLIYIYNLFFIGILLKYSLIQSHIVQRLNMYFYGLQIIVAAYALYFLHKEKKKRLSYTLTSLYILTFVATMLSMNKNTALFRFFWDAI